MSEPTILRAQSGADLLAALPRLTGLHAPDSLFVLFMQGNRTTGSARIDLPTRGQLDDSPFLFDWISQVGSIVDASDGAVLVIDSASFPVGDLGELDVSVPRGLASMLRLEASTRGPKLIDVLAKGPDGWARLTGEESGTSLRPLAEIAESSLHDPGFVPQDLASWREDHPDQSAETAEEIAELTARVRDGSAQA